MDKKIKKRGHSGFAVVLSLSLFSGSPANASTDPTATPTADGAVQLPATTVPLSDYVTDRGKQVIITKDAWALGGFTTPSGDPNAEVSSAALQASCATQSKQIIRRLDQQYPSVVEHVFIAGVPASIVTPKRGIAPQNRNRILINMHGGGFIGKCPDGLVEAMPIAATGGFKVVTIDYREAPEAKFPAASIDVAAVYRQLLKQYPAKNIGLYGCSAGGTLAGQATAWILAHGLPRPGAIGVFCAGLTVGIKGDSSITTRFMNSNSTTGIAHLLTYMKDVNIKDPMVSPGLDLTLLAKFPPVLFITATRDNAMSNAIFSNNQLAKVGVDSELHVWDGLWHSFFFDDLPEARDANNVIVHFFDKRLGRSSVM